MKIPLRFFASLLLPLSLSAQETLFRYEIASDSTLRLTTDVIVRGKGTSMYRFALATGSDPERATAFDRATGRKLVAHVDGGKISVELGRSLNDRAEFRLGIQEELRSKAAVRSSGGGLVFDYTLQKGRHAIQLPPGFAMHRCSVPAQVQTDNGRVEVGIVHGDETPLRLTLEARPGTLTQAVVKGSFRALDDRTVTYYLESPETHRIRLWLEIYVMSPGQSHFYSQLRTDDAIREPVTIDMDRGIELPTRIVTGNQANANGDSSSSFPDDASVLVADLGYKIPEHGSARIRSYQIATDPRNYRAEGNEGFHLDRFIARSHSVYVLPAGWELTSIDQPAAIGRDKQGRVVLDLVLGGGEANRLLVTGCRTK